jgi:hypothetical protein
MLVVSDADFWSDAHVPVTVTGTVPTLFGAVHTVFCCAAFANVPVGALHRYVMVQPIESCAVAVTCDVAPVSTVHGLHAALTVRL